MEKDNGLYFEFHLFSEVWRDGLWTKEDDEEMVIEKMEAQAWICLYNLLSTREVAAFFYAKLAKLSPTKNILMFLCRRKVMEKYPLNDFRVGVLTRLQVFEQKRNHDNILLQISSNCLL